MNAPAKTPHLWEQLAALRPMLDALDGLAYLVDASGMLLAVSEPDWDRFAEENGAICAQAGSVIGRPLLEAIRSPDLRRAYEGIHRDVLSGERPAVSFEYRCDGPEVRRSMRMAVTRVKLDAGAPLLLYQSQLLSATPRPWVSLFEPSRLLDMVRAEAAYPIVTLCGVCQHVRWPADADRWIEPEAYYREGGPADVRVSHGLCQPCADRL